MPYQRMTLRKDPTPSGKAIKLPEKVIFSLPHLITCRSLFFSLTQNVGLQLAEEAAVQEGGKFCRLGGKRQGYKEGVVFWAVILNKLH